MRPAPQIGVSQDLLCARFSPLGDDGGKKRATGPDKESNIGHTALLRNRGPALEDKAKSSYACHSTQLLLLLKDGVRTKVGSQNLKDFSSN